MTNVQQLELACGLIKQARAAWMKNFAQLPGIEKTAASIAKRVNLTPSPKRYSGELFGYRANEEIPSTLRTSGSRRYISFDSDVNNAQTAHTVQGSAVSDLFQSIGLGRKMYGGAIRRAFEDYEKGGPRWFLSDKSGRTSGDASNLWRALQRRGYPIRSYEDLPHELNASSWGIDLDDMSKFYKDKPMKIS
jgi:hypothetical protein